MEQMLWWANWLDSGGTLVKMPRGGRTASPVALELLLSQRIRHLISQNAIDDKFAQSFVLRFLGIKPPFRLFTSMFLCTWKTRCFRQR